MYNIKFSAEELNWMLSSILEESTFFEDWEVEYVDCVEIRPYRECSIALKEKIKNLLNSHRAVLDKYRPWERFSVQKINDHKYLYVFYNDHRKLVLTCVVKATIERELNNEFLKELASEKLVLIAVGVD